MEISVRLFAYFTRYLPRSARAKRAAIELPEAARVTTLVKALGIPDEAHEDEAIPYVAIVNGEHVPPDTILHHGDEVSLFPPLAGG